MNEIISAAIGVIVGVILNDPLIAMRNWFLHQIRKFYVKRKKRKEYTGLFHFGNINSKWYVVDGDGQEKYTPQSIITHFENNPLVLPAELKKKKEYIAKQQGEKRKKGEQYYFNGENYKLEKYSVARFSTEESPELHLWFRPSDYYTFLATDMSLDDEKLKEKYFPDSRWTQPPAYFANSFGINLVIITKDDRIVLTKRSEHVGTNQNMYHISVNEGLSRTFDRGVTTQAPDVYRAAIRGIIEELGVQDVSASDIDFLSLGVDTRYCQWALLGKVRINKTSEEVITWRENGVKDKWENTDFFVIPFELSEVVKFVAQHDPWTPAGLTCIYHTLVNEFGHDRVEKAIQKHFK